LFAQKLAKANLIDGTEPKTNKNSKTKQINKNKNRYVEKKQR